MENKLLDIGHTPLIRLKNIEEKYHLPFALYAKNESLNPTGSIKDRPALSIIKNALMFDEIDETSTIVEATSGNMGISLAFIAKEYNMKCMIFMPESASIERREKMKQYGAEIVLIKGGMSECVSEAIKCVRSHPQAFYCDQFANPNNALAHYENTSMEIIASLGHTPNYFIAGFGTSGTLIGNGTRFKEINPETKIIGLEPAASPLVTKGEAHPHLIQGIGANFIPDLYDESVVDEVLTITNEEAYEGVRILQKEEGLFLGITSGCNLMGALKYKDKITPNSDVVIILPDSGDRYLSIGDLYV